ncbi:MAG: hypothetical protein NVS9B1_20770 [Candidatus Dormibacteraceae bacterium]
MARLRLALPGALAALFLFPAAASAHAQLLAADPGPGVLAAAPAAVELTFSEPVTPFGSGIRVFGPGGGQVATGSARVDGVKLRVEIGTAGRGTYLVEWRVVGQDTHPSRGSFTFSVGAPGPVPAGDGLGADVGAVNPIGLLLQVFARWFHFAGLALAFGPAVLAVAIGEDVGGRRLGRLTGVGIGLLLASEPLSVAGQAASLGGLDGTSVADVLASAFGRVAALRLAAPLLLWGVVGAIGGIRGRAAWPVLAVGGGVVLVDGLGGHTIPGLPGGVGWLLTAVHEGSMVVWVGGLAAVLVVLSAAPDRRRLVAGFGRVALPAAALTVASGALLALAHLGKPGDLVFSAFGMVLALKVVAVAVALAAAGVGLRRDRSGRMEAVALAGVLALAGLLASLPPPR